MHLTRAESKKILPIPRKGSKYVARALGYVNNSVPVVVALRDILKLARSSNEVKLMIHDKTLKINGRDVKDLKEPIRIFNILQAGENKYELRVLSTGRFVFEETKNNDRIGKVVGKTTLKGKKVQINLHDGSNFLYSGKINVGDSVIIGDDGKVKNVSPLEAKKKVFVFSGRRIGSEGSIETINGKKAVIKFDDRSVELDQSHVIVTK